MKLKDIDLSEMAKLIQDAVEKYKKEGNHHPHVEPDCFGIDFVRDSKTDAIEAKVCFYYNPTFWMFYDGENDYPEVGEIYNEAYDFEKLAFQILNAAEIMQLRDFGYGGDM